MARKTNKSTSTRDAWISGYDKGVAEARLKVKALELAIQNSQGAEREYVIKTATAFEAFLRQGLKSHV